MSWGGLEFLKIPRILPSPSWGARVGKSCSDWLYCEFTQRVLTPTRHVRLDSREQLGSRFGLLPTPGRSPRLTYRAEEPKPSDFFAREPD